LSIETVRRSSRRHVAGPERFRLIAHREAPVTREELLDKVWGYHAIPYTRTVDVHIAQLRQKLEDKSKQARYIVTVYGYGYKFVPSPETVSAA